jgi:hypothetical protein
MLFFSLRPRWFSANIHQLSQNGSLYLYYLFHRRDNRPLVKFQTMTIQRSGVSFDIKICIDPGLQVYIVCGINT